MNNEIEPIKSGLYRKVDDVGRIVIPKKLRKKYRIETGDVYRIFMDEDERVVMEKDGASLKSMLKRREGSRARVEFEDEDAANITIDVDVSEASANDGTNKNINQRWNSHERSRLAANLEAMRR